MDTVSPWLKPLDNFAPFPGDDLSGWISNIGHAEGKWSAYVHLVVLGALAAFAMAWSMGANDAANAFGTSVGAKTLHLWQAVIISSIFEFLGAILLGGEVAKTIAGGITSPDFFVDMPEVFSYGMLCALISAAVIVALATYYHTAVSPTHSVIGAIIGFGLIFGGSDSITWNQKTNTFPYRTGVVTVFMSWFIAPISTAILGALIFLLVRTFILRHRNSTELAFWFLPLLAFITIYINIFFVLYKGAGKQLKGQVGALYWDTAGSTAGWVSAIAGGSAAILSIPAVFWLKRKHANKFSSQVSDLSLHVSAPTRTSTMTSSMDDTVKTMEEGKQEQSSDVVVWCGVLSNAVAKVKAHLSRDAHEDVHKCDIVAALHANAEVFDSRTEEVFKFLQVFSATCLCFAHGSNDVSNAIGPFAGIWYVYNTHNVSADAETPKWILALGGAGIVVGLAQYGFNIIKVLGVSLIKVTPPRGFSAELSTSLITVLASIYGLPISTTQCIVGAEIGIGLVERGGGLTGVNWKLLLKTFLGWVVAFATSGFFCAALFSFGAYAPSINDLDYVNNYHNALSSVMTAQLNVMNSTNEYRQANALATYSLDLETQLTTLRRDLATMLNLKKNGKINMYDMMYTLKQVTGLYLTETIPAYNTTA